MLSPIHVRNFNNFRFFKSAKMSFDITESQNFQFGMFYCRLINHAIFGTLWIGKKNCQKIQILSMLNLSLKCVRFYDIGIIRLSIFYASMADIDDVVSKWKLAYFFLMRKARASSIFIHQNFDRSLAQFFQAIMTWTIHKSWKKEVR